MNIYFAGLGGVGIGPLALIAREMGYLVTGSDLSVSRYTKLMEMHGIGVSIGQDGSALRKTHEHIPVDWFVYTAALPDDHPELVYAKVNGIKTTLRGPFINHILEESGQKLLAVGGTHGKTTTTGMLIWAFQQLGEPLSHAIGTNITFGDSGHFDKKAKYFAYEADEYEKQFLDFHPDLAILTNIEHDHPDSYPTALDYYAAFQQFSSQSGTIVSWSDDLERAQIPEPDSVFGWHKSVDLGPVTLPGIHNRQNAFLAFQALKKIFPNKADAELFAALDSFPGTERRFELLSTNLYTDYAHHPTEIAAVIQMAKELSNDIVVIYQPHQNRRQHEIVQNGGYESAFEGANKVYWLPTYLSREDSAQTLLSSQDLANTTTTKDIIRPAQMDPILVKSIVKALAEDNIVILMAAGSADQWLRANLREIEASRTA